MERPLRLHSQLTTKAIESLRFASGDEDLRGQLYDEFGDALFENFASVEGKLRKRLADWGNEEEGENTGEGLTTGRLPDKKKKKLLDAGSWWRDARLVEIATDLRQEVGDRLFEDHNDFRNAVNLAVQKLGLKVSGSDLKVILRSASWRVETAPAVIAKIHKPAKTKTDPLQGRYDAELGGKKWVVEYEPDSELRDTEQVPLLEEGGIDTFIRRKVLPYTPDAWIKKDATRIGYEISFTRHFYRPQALRTLQEIRADILAAGREAEGLLDELLKEGA
jgi:type I restriction enzyme M protein